MQEMELDAMTAEERCSHAGIARGFGPACRAAAEGFDKTLDEIRRWKEDEEDSVPPDKDFHDMLLRCLGVTYDVMKLRRDAARASEVDDSKGALDFVKREPPKWKESYAIRARLVERAKELRGPKS
jgi:hypothetical protein